MKNLHVNFIKDNISDCQKICDLGPGTGRLVESYAGKDVTFMDIHEGFRSRLYESCKRNNVSYSFKLIEHLSNLPYGDNSFDAIVLSLVLLHVPHKDIEGVIREVLRVTDRLIVIDVCPDYRTSALHVFTHDFYELARKNGCGINVVLQDIENSLVLFIMSSKT
jgi:ubiquinone/menaquinone biosynthesis C-methylase UbiE